MTRTLKDSKITMRKMRRRQAYYRSHDGRHDHFTKAQVYDHDLIP